MTVTATRTAPTGRLAGSAASYYLIAFATAILLLVGLAVVLSSSSIDSIKLDGDPFALFKAQVAFLGIGVALLIVATRATPPFLKSAAPWLLLISMVLLVLVAVSPWGHSSGGNRNWIVLGEFTAQPSEAAKFGLALYLGVMLSRSRHRLATLKGAFVPAGLVSLLVMGLVVAGRDIGTASVMLLLIAAAYWTAGLPLRFFATGATMATLGVWVLIWLRPEILSRITAWRSPTCDPTNQCFQSTHGTWALASGGLWGLGPGLSREKWSYLPKASNDFIYAILGEEFGLVGTLLVLVALAMIVVAVNRIVQRHRDPFVQITAAAIAGWIVGQACLNIAVVVGLAPVTGVPLPLVSSGGSSLITSLAGIGVLLAYAKGEPGAREALAARKRRRLEPMTSVPGGER